MTDHNTHEFTDISNRKYWFVRTDSGEHFEAFYKNNFIGIGWNSITFDILKFKPEHEVKELIKTEFVEPEAKKGALSLRPSKIQGKVTTILNKIKNFNSLSEGDIVIIPSHGSWELAFGVVQGEAYESYARTGGCPYSKRRKIEWIKRREFRTLDAKFALIRKTIHAISEIDEKFYDIINNTMYDSYVKGSVGNISIRVQLGEQEEVDYGLLKSFIDDLIDISKFFEDENQVANVEDNVYIKLNLQSPGYINLKREGVGLILALGLLSSACEEGVDKSNISNGSTSTSKTVQEKGIPEEKILDAMRKGQKLKALTTKKTAN